MPYDAYGSFEVLIYVGKSATDKSPSFRNWKLVYTAGGTHDEFVQEGQKLFHPSSWTRQVAVDCSIGHH